MQTSPCVLPIAAPPAPAALLLGGVFCMVLSWGLSLQQGFGNGRQYLVGGKVFAKCWSRQSIRKIQSASQFSPFISAVVVCGVLCLRETCPTWLCHQRAGGLHCHSLPPLATSRNVGNPTGFKEEGAQQVKSKGSSVCSVRRAEL